MRIIPRRTLLLPIVSLLVVMLACALGQSLRHIQTYPELEDGIGQITVADDCVFVAMGSNGVFLLNPTDGAAPTRVDWKTRIDSAFRIAVDENYAYVIDKDRTLHMVDISDLSNPMVLGSYTPDTPSIEVDIQFPYAFLTTGAGGLHVIDVSEPTTLERVGVYNLTVNNFEPAIWDVAVSGEYAYITLSDPKNHDFVEVLNISNPATPTKVGSVRVNLASNIAIQGDYAFVANGHGLQILDVSNPHSPIVITSYDTPNTALGLKVEGNYVYINDLYGMEVVDISDIHSPRRVAYAKLPQVQDVAVVDGYIYVADSFKGLVIFKHP